MVPLDCASACQLQHLKQQKQTQQKQTQHEHCDAPFVNVRRESNSTSPDWRIRSLRGPSGENRPIQWSVADRSLFRSSCTPLKMIRSAADVAVRECCWLRVIWTLRSRCVLSDAASPSRTDAAADAAFIMQNSSFFNAEFAVYDVQFIIVTSIFIIFTIKTAPILGRIASLAEWLFRPLCLIQNHSIALSELSRTPHYFSPEDFTIRYPPQRIRLDCRNQSAGLEEDLMEEWLHFQSSEPFLYKAHLDHFNHWIRWRCPRAAWTIHYC